MEQKIKRLQMQHDKKLNDMIFREELAFKKSLEKQGKELEDKLKRKLNAKINKKKTQYKKKLNNDIKKLKGLKIAPPTPKKYSLSQKFEFLLEIAQQNARLKGTNEYWYWHCISCNKLFHYKDLVGWHRYSRQIRALALEERNINAQCKKCNYITWPMGNANLKLRANTNYDKNLSLAYPQEAKHFAQMYWETNKNIFNLNKIDFISKSKKLIAANQILRKNKKFKNNIDWGKKFKKIFGIDYDCA